MVKFETMVLGELETNCFLVWEEEEKQCFIIDPADDGVAISEEIQARGLKPIGILATHGHFDHILGALDLKLIYNIPFYCSSQDGFLIKTTAGSAGHWLKKKIQVPNIQKIDTDLNDGKDIYLGKETIKVIKTPGHTPGSVCFYLPNSEVLFSGDTIFAGLRGTTDHNYSSTKEIYESIRKLMKLPEETVILSGHGPETTIGSEKSRYGLSY